MMEISTPDSTCVQPFAASAGLTAALIRFGPQIVLGVDLLPGVGFVLVEIGIAIIVGLHLLRERRGGKKKRDPRKGGKPALNVHQCLLVSLEFGWEGYFPHTQNNGNRLANRKPLIR
jgi:hypothetical protein